MVDDHDEPREYSGRFEWLRVPQAKGGLVTSCTPSPLTIYVPDPAAWVGALADALTAARAPDDPRLDEILSTVKRLVTMNTSVQQTIDANNLATATALDAIQTDVTEIAAELPGFDPTQPETP